jgi:hypothetical protein
LPVRFDDNDYSVPMEYAYQDVVVKGYTDHAKNLLIPGSDRRPPTLLGPGTADLRSTALPMLVGA